MLSAIGRAAIRRAGIGAIRPSSGHITEWPWQAQRAVVAQNGTQAHSSRETRATQFSTRSYATASKSPAKPRAKKAITTKTSATIKRASTAAKKKLKAKPKKKVAARRKIPARKPLTDAQKVKKAEVKTKEHVKELKVAALLAEPKNLPATAWAVLFTEAVKEQKSQDGASFSGVTSVITNAATRYKNLNSSEREHYNHIANQNKAANDAAYQKWVESHTPDQIRIANAARSSLKQKQAKKGSQKFSLIEDSRLPKRPRNARALFTADRWASGDLKGISFTEAAKTLQEDWNNLSASEKKQYENKATAESARYAQEYKTVYHHDMPTRSKAASATA